MKKKKTTSKDNILYNSIYINFQNDKIVMREQISGCQRLSCRKGATISG